MADNELFRFFTGNRGVPRKKSSSVVNHNALDDGVLQDMTAKAELFRKTREDKPLIETEDGKSRELDQWDGIVGDTFRSLHTKEAAGVLDDEAILPSQEPTRRVLQRFIASEQFGDMKPSTTHDEIASAFGTMSAKSKLQELATNQMKEMYDEAENAEKQENQIERAEVNLEKLREQAREMHEQGQPIPQDLRDEINKTVDRKTNARQRLSKVQQKMADLPITNAASEVIKEAAEDAKKGVEVVNSLPGMGPGQRQQMNADEALRLAALFAENPRLFQIARMLGRIVREMRFKRAKRMQGGVEEVVDVMLGNDLPQVLPAQLMHLRHRLLKRWFLRRYIQASLLQRERRGTTEAGRGPLVACVDESSSMSGMQFTWAKALCMAIMAIARKEKRDAAIVSYSSTGQVESWEFPFKAQMNANEIVEMASHNFNGGTDITGALERAKQIVDKDQKFTRADIVLITDGEDHWRDDDRQMRDELKNRAVRIHGIQVGGRPSKYLEECCETVASAMDLTGANEASDMLATNIN